VTVDRVTRGGYGDVASFQILAASPYWTQVVAFGDMLIVEVTEGVDTKYLGAFKYPGSPNPQMPNTNNLRELKGYTDSPLLV
jgi:hypothetical protein